MIRPEVQYAVLIADLNASRDHPVRGELQRILLEEVLAPLNREFGPGQLATPMTLTAGDELQVVCRRPAMAVTLVQELSDRLLGSGLAPGDLERVLGALREGIDLRQGASFGVGYGPITTGPLPPYPDQAPNPAHLDGPAFHRARAALERAKSKDNWVHFEGFGEDADRMLNALFHTIWAVRSKWSTMQAIYTYRIRTRRTQKALAQEFQVSPSTISESLDAAGYRAVIEAEEAALRCIERATEVPT